MVYTGIGSRETPQEILDYFTILGSFFAKRGLILRSGGANGADKAFEIGCDKSNGNKEIYLPWKGFNDSDSNLIIKDPEAFKIAEKFHPYWKVLKQGAQKLHGRNVHQVLGWDLNSKTDFVICFTQNGNGQGGTGQALRIAKAYDVPIFDAGKYSDIETIKKELRAFLIEHNIFTEAQLTKNERQP